MIDHKRKTQRFTLSSFTFGIPWNNPRFKNCSEIMARCELTDDTHPHVFASTCLRADPARRLGVHVEGVDLDGKAYQGWLSSRGKMAPMQMNTLVDLLQGVSREDSMAYPRRWVTHTTPGVSRSKICHLG